MAETVCSGTVGGGVKEKLTMARRGAGTPDVFLKIVCVLLFVTFSLVYLYHFQADLLAAMQQTFSHGQTHYDRSVGTVLIAVVLLLVQIGVDKLCRKSGVAFALTFFPSAVLLATLTAASPDGNGWFSFGGWVVGMPIALLVFWGAVWLCYKTDLSAYLSDCMGNVRRRLWVNVLIMSALASFVGIAGNGNKITHARVHIEYSLARNDCEEAISTLKSLGKPDSCLTMLAAYTLSKDNQLGDRLFEFPLTGGASVLLPNGKNVSFVVLPENKMYDYLGGRFVQKMSAMRYLQLLQRYNMLSRAGEDYLLCAYLLDKRLDDFAKNVEAYYTINDSLPRHYREALVLYNHLRSAPTLLYSNNVMNADFQDYQKMNDTIKNKNVRECMLSETFGNTYWYYYQTH